ncbi:hypothetical protein pb186bvf_005244 [Paramecium bursaria]
MGICGTKKKEPNQQDNIFLSNKDNQQNQDIKISIATNVQSEQPQKQIKVLTSNEKSEQIMFSDQLEYLKKTFDKIEVTNQKVEPVHEEKDIKYLFVGSEDLEIEQVAISRIDFDMAGDKTDLNLRRFSQVGKEYSSMFNSMQLLQKNGNNSASYVAHHNEIGFHVKVFYQVRYKEFIQQFINAQDSVLMSTDPVSQIVQRGLQPYIGFDYKASKTINGYGDVYLISKLQEVGFAQFILSQVGVEERKIMAHQILTKYKLLEQLDSNVSSLRALNINNLFLENGNLILTDWQFLHKSFDKYYANSLFVIPGVFPLKISPYEIMNCCEIHLKFIIICLLTNTSPNSIDQIGHQYGLKQMFESMLKLTKALRSQIPVKKALQIQKVLDEITQEDQMRETLRQIYKRLITTGDFNIIDGYCSRKINHEDWNKIKTMDLTQLQQNF